MRRTLRKIARRTSQEELGVSLTELLVSMLMLTFVLGAVLGLMDATAKQAPRDEERAVAIREAEAGLHRMTRELRQAYKVLDAQPKSIYVLVARSVPPDLHVKYDCDIAHPANATYRRCLRWEAPIGQILPLTGPGEVVIDRGLSEVAFNYAPSALNPTFVEIHLKVPQTGEREGGHPMSFVLEDGVYLRNTDVAG